MSRTLYLAATLAALALITGCGDTVDSPSPVDGSTDTGNTDTGVITSTLTIEMGDIAADVTVTDVGKADSSTVYTGWMVAFQRVEIEVDTSTYSITLVVDGFEPWTESITVDGFDVQIYLPDESELEPEEVEVDYSWLTRTWTCLNVASAAHSPFENTCTAGQNSLDCDRVLTDVEYDDENLSLMPDLPGFDYILMSNYYECR